MFAASRAPVLTALVLLAGCATKPVAIVPPSVVATLPPPRPAMPAGGAPGMVIPAMLADGSYPTPNRGVSSAGATWHLRAALNVAALACRGPQESTIVAGYNAMLAAHKTGLRDAEARLAGEYQTGGQTAAIARDRYDDAMTRLYNFFSQSFARDAFCRTAVTVLSDSVTVSPAAFEAFAASRLPQLEQPFTDFYRDYDAWRSGQPARPAMIFAAVPATATPATATPALPRVAPQYAANTPRPGIAPAQPRAVAIVRPVVAPVLAAAAAPVVAAVARPAAPATATPSIPRLSIDVSALPSD